MSAASREVPSATESLSLGLGIAGIVAAGAYITGVASGSTIELAGALLLIFVGRVVAGDAGDDVVLGVAAVALAGALAVASLRFATFDLEAIRGAQAVLGPAALVGPLPDAATSILAALGGLAATALLAAPGGPWSKVDLVHHAGTATIVLAVVTLVWGPAWAGRGMGAGGALMSTAAWVAAGSVALVLVWAAALGGRRLRWGRQLLAGVAGVCVLAAAALLLEAGA